MKKNFLAVLSLLWFFSSAAYAFNAYHLYNKNGVDHWAIECADGTLFSYAGGSAGLPIVGPSLCENHGGVADPGNNGDITTRPTTRCAAVGRPVGRVPARNLDFLN